MPNFNQGIKTGKDFIECSLFNSWPVFTIAIFNIFPELVTLSVVLTHV